MDALQKRVGIGLKYGDIIQLEHPRSQTFLLMQKDPADVNPTCHKVSFGSGQAGAHLRILPRFKVRTLGTPVYSEDEFVLQSVALEPLILGCSPRPKDKFWGVTKADAARLELRLPSSLRTGPCFEVNGAFELRSFVIHFYYRRFNECYKQCLLTGIHNFRLFYPESSSFFCASGDPDKGEVLDAKDPSKQTRMRGEDQQTPAHVPYLKAVYGDPNLTHNASFKSVWCIESLDSSTSTVVEWGKSYRLRHVASGKYLAVETLVPASRKMVKKTLPKLRDGPLSLDDDEDGQEYDNDNAAELFTAALVSTENQYKLHAGSLGSLESMMFSFSPTDEAGEKFVNGINTLRLEHRAASGEILYFVSAREPKLELASLKSTNDDIPENDLSKDNHTAPRVSLDTVKKNFAASLMMEKVCGGRVLFSSVVNNVDVLKLLPLLNTESVFIARLTARLKTLHIYTYFASTHGNLSNTPKASTIFYACQVYLLHFHSMHSSVMPRC